MTVIRPEPNRRLARPPKQKRAQERYEFLLNCAEELLTKGSEADGLPEISVYALAEAANLAPPAIYRYFPSTQAVNHGLAQRYMDQIANLHELTDLSGSASWQAGITKGFRVSKDFYNGTPFSLPLVLGPNASIQTHAADRQNNSVIAQLMLPLLKDTVWPIHSLVTQREVEITIAIVDAIWIDSYVRHGSITEEYFGESMRATIAYLELYTARHIPGSPIGTEGTRT